MTTTAAAGEGNGQTPGSRPDREYLSGRMRESGHKTPMESIFIADFLATLTPVEGATLTRFEAAATKYSRPIVRKTCSDAGFVGDASEMETDPIFLAFQKWIRWTETNSPTTGLVVGDTWSDFRRQYHDLGQRSIYFVVEDVTAAPEVPVEGSVHVAGRPTKSALSVKDAVTMRRLSEAQLGCLVVNLEMLLLSLLFPELDGIPVLQQVTGLAKDADSMTVSLLLTCGTAPYDFWPLIPSVPSFEDHNEVCKDLCVPQLIGFLQFSIIPRHPMKGAGSDGKSVNWALSSGTWTTTQYNTKQAELMKRKRQPEGVENFVHVDE